MYGHVLAKGGDLFGECEAGFGGQAVHPEAQGALRGGEKTKPFFRFELLRLGERREARGVENFVRVGVADTAQDAGISEGALERVVLDSEGLAKCFGVGGEDVYATGVYGAQTFFALEDMQRSAALRAGFGQSERSFAGSRRRRCFVAL